MAIHHGVTERATVKIASQHMPDTYFERFWLYVQRAPITKCWEWKGTKRDGYGVFMFKHKSFIAHRASYEIYNGCIPDGLQIDYLCRNRSCVNPTHLQAVTQKTNVLRGIGLSAENARKMICKHGHPFTDDNTRYAIENGRLRRYCKTCVRQNSQKRRDAALAHEG